MLKMDILVLQTVCLITIFGVTLFGALLPLKVFGDMKKPKSKARQHRSERILSFSNCLAGGVFMATCFLGLIPAARKKFQDVFEVTAYQTDYPVCEATVVAGFFIILYMEQIFMLIQEKWTRARTTDIKMQKLKQQENRNIIIPGEDTIYDEEDIYSRDAEETKPMLNGSSDSWSEDKIDQNSEDNIDENDSQSQGHGHSHGSGSGHSHLGNLQNSGFLRSLILLFALSVHSVFEGMALGLQDEVKTALYLLLAMVLHEGLAAFALGASLLKNSVSFTLYVIYGVAFSSMIPFGTIIGMLIQSSPGIVADTVSAIMQALAAGIFIFVTFFEILNHEFESSEDRLLKICCSLFGYIALAALEMLG